MKQLAPAWHTAHLEQCLQPMNAFHVRNRSTGEDVRVVVHAQPCAICMALVADAVWPTMTSNLEVPKISKSPAAAPGKA